MPRTNCPPSDRLHKARRCAVVTIDGRNHYLGTFGSEESHAKYARLIAAWRASRRPITATLATRSGDPGPSIDELMLAYWERHVVVYYVKDNRSTSERDNIRQALRFLRRLHGTTPASEFGLSSHHALLTVAGLRKGRSEARERPPVAPVPDDVVERTLPLLSPTVAAMVRLQRLTGMRPQEVILMRGADIDRGDPDCWLYRPSRHKGQHGGRERLVYLGPKCRELLRPFLAIEPSGYLFSPRQAEAERLAGERARRTSPPRPNQPARLKAEPKRRPGDVYDGGAYRKAIRRACKKLGLPIWFPHQLRHSAASEFRSWYGLEASQALLGHAELGTTQIYAEVDRAAARRIMAEAG